VKIVKLCSGSLPDSARVSFVYIKFGLKYTSILHGNVEV